LVNTISFPAVLLKFKALQESTWEKFHPHTQELEHGFFAGSSHDHVADYILHFKGNLMHHLLSYKNANSKQSYKSSRARSQEKDDLSIIIHLARHNSQGKWVNKEMLIARSRWDLPRINAALDILVQEGMARKIDSRSTGTRWYFPGA